MVNILPTHLYGWDLFKEKPIAFSTEGVPVPVRQSNDTNVRCRCGYESSSANDTIVRCGYGYESSSTIFTRFSTAHYVPFPNLEKCVDGREFGSNGRVSSYFGSPDRTHYLEVFSSKNRILFKKSLTYSLTLVCCYHVAEKFVNIRK